ncbi:MAG: DUF928 domain-containing protein [Burkholderiales bacterium]|nr:DUF928 domain-containing protein [Burkholderiales bacterium]
MKGPWTLAIAIAWSGFALAQAPKDAPVPPKAAAPAASAQVAPAAAPQAAQAVAYKPPSRGAPQRRVGGASRGAADKAPVVSVLAPDHVGYSLEEQPDLYWFISRPSAVRIELTLIDGRSPAPTKEVVLEGARSAGIQRFSLREHGVRLAEGTDYEWSVAVVPDTESRSADILSGGALRRVASDPALAARLKALSGTARAAALAEAGIWYDALATLGREADANPQDGAVRRVRADLLDQVGLKEAAAFERR